MKPTAQIIVLALLFGSLTACAQKKGNQIMEQKSKTLVAYFSATGTTESVAKMIATATGGELYTIQPEKQYSPADLDWTVKSSRCCQENNNPKSRPAFVKQKENLNDYDIIYLGYPNWWNMAPRIVNTFIETYGLQGKTVIPFMTSGGNGIENSVKILRKDYPEIKWQNGKLLNSVTQDEVNEWVKSM